MYLSYGKNKQKTKNTQREKRTTKEEDGAISKEETKQEKRVCGVYIFVISFPVGSTIFFVVVFY